LVVDGARMIPVLVLSGLGLTMISNKITGKPFTWKPVLAASGLGVVFLAFEVGASPVGKRMAQLFLVSSMANNGGQFVKGVESGFKAVAAKGPVGPTGSGGPFTPGPVRGGGSGGGSAGAD
jgi:hypothetical protein